MLIRSGLLLIPLTFLLPLHGQDDGPIKMTPDLALAVPLLQKGKEVTLKFPILMNPTTVLTPGTTLRVMYIPPIQNDSEDLALAHKGDMSQSFSRSTLNGDEQSKMPPELAHELERQRRIIWTVPINFQLAMAQLPTDNLHLIYCAPGDNRHLLDQRFSFFDGLFLGSPSGGVTVLGVETGSAADKAGFKAGDQILAVSGTPISNDLSAFPAVYGEAKKNAKESHAASYAIVVKSTGEAGSHTLNVPTPPSIKSMLMQGF